MHKPLIRLLLLTVVFMPPAHATNGINLIGFGAESIGMGGADLAVARDTTALNTNPAGLSQIQDKRLDLYVSLARALNIRHEDEFGNNETIDNEWAYIADAAYAQSIGGFTFGIGAFAQGGIGIVYKNLNTAFGTTDELSAQFRIARFTLGASWQATDKLSIGASLLITYADLEQKIFSDTSVNNTTNPEQTFFGQDLEGADTIEPGYKIGLLYSINPTLRLGIAYTSKTKLTLEGGSVRLNMTDAGLGIITYRDVKIGGINQPEEFGIGLAWDINTSWLISGEINWINWSEAINTSFLTISNPDNTFAPPTLSQQIVINWDDQYVFALGMAYSTQNNSVYRAGINVANNPVPNESISPLLAPIAKYHITAGYGTTLSDKWRFDSALEYQVKESETYTNPQLPFGANAVSTLEALFLHVVFSRQW